MDVSVQIIAFAVEGQVWEKTRWLQSLEDMYKKFKVDYHIHLEREYKDVKFKYAKEVKERKDLYNQVVEMKGNIRVFCQCQPLNSEETEGRATMAFGFESTKDGELTLKSSHRSFKKVYKFDSVFSPAKICNEGNISFGVRNVAQWKLLDELGISAVDILVDQFTPLGCILYKALSDGKWEEHEVNYLLFIVRDVNLHPNLGEVADVKYVNRDQLKEILRKVDAGEDDIKLSPWFRLVVDNFLFKWWDHVKKGTLLEVANIKTIHKLT